MIRNVYACLESIIFAYLPDDVNTDKWRQERQFVQYLFACVLIFNFGECECENIYIL